MKSLQNIIHEKLHLQSDKIKETETEYTFDLETLGTLTINVPFSLYIPSRFETVEIVKIIKTTDEFDEDVWAFYTNDKDLDEKWRTVTLSALGVKNLFINCPKSNNQRVCAPLIGYVNNGKYVGKRLGIRVAHLGDTIIDYKN